MSSEIQWHTEKKKLKDLKELENNPRTISPRAYEQLQNALKIGNFKPLIADIDGVILGGNQKYKALLEKHGEDYEVEVSIPERKLTEEEKKDVVILDNKHMGEDDPDVLADEFAASLEKFGFVDVIESVESDVNEFEQFDVAVESRKLVIFVFKSKEDQQRVLDILCSDTNNIDGEVLLKFLDENYGNSSSE